MLRRRYDGKWRRLGAAETVAAARRRGPTTQLAVTCSVTTTRRGARAAALPTRYSARARGVGTELLAVSGHLEGVADIATAVACQVVALLEETTTEHVRWEAGHAALN